MKTMEIVDGKCGEIHFHPLRYNSEGVSSYAFGDMCLINISVEHAQFFCCQIH